MLKSVHPAVKLRLRDHFNNIFNSFIPQHYKLSKIIRIHKPNTDKTSLNSYRPISLDSCFAKTLDKIIANRLWWFVSYNNSIDSRQTGFRKGKSISDNLLVLDHLISFPLLTKNHLSVISLDFTKAFDKIGVHTVVDCINFMTNNTTAFPRVRHSQLFCSSSRLTN